MKILVSNIGSTSFKFRLFDMGEGRSEELASGGADRIGGAGGVLKLQVQGAPARKLSIDFPDHGSAIRHVLAELERGGAIASPGDIGAVAFKAVMAGDVEPVVSVDDELLAKMEYFVPIAPIHNPPYIAAMRMFRQAMEGTPLVACFEPGFHRTIPARRTHYPIDPAWVERGVRRYGYHGASHAYIAARLARLMPAGRRVISCHLGGSSSLCAIRDGQSQAASMGLSPQSGLPQGTRVGDFDPYALKLMMDRTGRSMDDILAELGTRAGLAALSGTSGDVRDIEQAAAAGNDRARLALDVFTTAIRDYLGAYLVELGGADAIAFTGGIGQHQAAIRSAVCDGLTFAGIELDADKNAHVDGNAETRIDAATSKTAIWVLPTNEELIVATLAARWLTEKTTTENTEI
ncbi:MAG: Acetate kinase [Planctomycetes bacterium ADurb.Bin126]|nr:MAG: Acetate kinase [Planctomycetes bacterium ADurb.Bin126]HOD80784.1 acetate/propionate family kinase [Phycisphaerae bacterium]HQL72061.1 acetate/propionate family kinase [Phycisphaerae bacterium]